MGRFDDFDAFDDDPPEADHDTVGLGALARPVRLPLLITGVAALAGVIFAATSTADFTAHLDRQVHAIHCSVVPGATAEMGESGCRTVMLSPYSSWFRTQYWGGVPVALFALAVFAFLAYRALHLAVKGQPRRSEVFFLLAGTALPCLMSGIYGYLAATKVGATCTVCVGMYFASGFAFAGALVAFLLTRPAPSPDPRAVKQFALGFLEGCGFVGVLLVAYVAFVPEVKASAGRGPAGCGTLVQADDPGGVFLDLAVRPGATPSIELLDPLCPACRAFDGRLAASGLDARLSQRAVLFPLDATCNWMVKTSLHPGACAVSEAMLCEPASARKILDWAFAHQEDLLALAKTDEPGLRKQIMKEFPGVASCLGSPQAKNKIVQSLRWAVANALPVLTPQLFVNGRRMCDEDTDLGLEYTLTRMLEAKP
ncbi:MAG: hypothetical protein H6706_14080 [Myxococcales bacterium]|nr:hypothetical protein [Myxococcales bacterium]